LNEAAKRLAERVWPQATAAPSHGGSRDRDN
jgi:hypothetical protein